MIASIFVLFIGASVLLIVHLLREWLQPGLVNVPGPFLAKFSDLWRLYKVWNWSFKDSLPELHKKYDSSLIRIGPKLLSCSDPRAVETIYGFHSNFKKSDMVKAMAPIYQGKRQPTMFSAADNRTHAKIRRPVAPAYAMSNVILFEPFVDENIKTLFTKFDELFIKQAKPCDFDNWVYYWAFDVVLEMTMSRNFGFMKAGGDVDGVLNQLQKDLDYRGIALAMPIIDRICRLNPDRLTEPLDRDSKRPQDFVSAFLEAQRKDPGISDGQLIGYAQANLVAGSDTTSIVLRTAVYYSLKTPWIAKKIVEECDAKCKVFPVPYRTARFDMPFCVAVVRESLRMHFAFIGMMEREVPEGGCVMPDGISLPAGTVIGMHGDLIGRDKDIFGDDADEFNPLRWLCGPHESQTEFDERLKAMNSHDLAFGRGTRGCIGKHVAEMEIYKFVPTFFGLLKPRFVRPNEPWRLKQLFVFRQLDMDLDLEWREKKSLSSLRV
ncbi:cytochrome P450 [Acrodontium crateriforme]|uniref:Cytochrome P450 n=1 Tax=Acrodontium crateriforme TaxID=150365 RepID=A0AAQ3MDB1_9PEZI|nr:cytochrome P450 [Acrodontium crateriforme]